MLEVRSSGPEDADALYAIWSAAVDSTHDFLSAKDRAAIGPLVREYVSSAPLIVALLDGRPVAFMGTSGTHIDSLFVDPAAHGRGIGRALVGRVGRPATVDVNEQNASGVEFYERLGFRTFARSPTDDQGRPYPLLHLRLD